MTNPHIPTSNHLPYRPGVGIMLINRDGRVFVAKRIDTISEAWQMPQGGIDDGEDPRTAALRELEEEIGTNRAEIIAESADWYSYDLPDEIIPKIWGGKYRGQKQKWFALRFTGSDADINIQTAHPEFCEWKWVPMHELPNLIVPFKRELYAALVAEFTPFSGNRS
jgi:putative (di)nucleoside polyphosphate hydrolase